MTKEAQEPKDEALTGSFKIYTKTTARQHDIYLDDDVPDESANYAELLHFLNDAADSTDTVNLHLSNTGGSIRVGLRLCQALKNCKATSVIHAEADCYSMGSIIALCGDALILYPGAFLMFHNYSIWHGGKGGESHTASTEYQNQFLDIMIDFCYPFLSKAEIKRLAEDKDFYVRPKDADLKVRLKRHFKRMEIR